MKELKTAESIQKSSRFEVWLDYSSDNVPESKEDAKINRLNKGGDLVTKVLKHFNVPFHIQLASDFYHPEPLLRGIFQYDKYGNKFTLLGPFPNLAYPCYLLGFDGEDEVTKQLEVLGVIPISYKEAIKRFGGKDGS